MFEFYGLFSVCFCGCSSALLLPLVLAIARPKLRTNPMVLLFIGALALLISLYLFTNLGFKLQVLIAKPSLVQMLNEKASCRRLVSNGVDESRFVYTDERLWWHSENDTISCNFSGSGDNARWVCICQ